MKTNKFLQGMIYKPLRNFFCLFLVCHDTSIKETITAAIIPNAWSALNVGAPHCKGYGMLILREWKVTWKMKNMDVNISQCDIGKSPNHCDEDMRLARSVRQLIWVTSAVCLYAPLAVRMWAYTHTRAMHIRSENLSKTGTWRIFTCLRYWESATKSISIGRPISTHFPTWKYFSWISL